MKKRYFAMCLILAFVLFFGTLPAVKAGTITFTFEDSNYNYISNKSIYWGTSSGSVTNYLGYTDSYGQISTTFSQTGTVYFKTSAGDYTGSTYIYSGATSKTIYMTYGRTITFTFEDSSYNYLSYESIYWGTSSGSVNNYLGYTDSYGQISTTFSQTGTVYFKTSAGTYSGSAYIYSSTTSKTVYMSASVPTIYFRDSSNYPICYASVYYSTNGSTWSYLGSTDYDGKITSSDFPYVEQTVYFRVGDEYETCSKYISSSSGGSTYVTMSPKTGGLGTAAVLALLLIVGIVGGIIYTATREKRPSAPRPKPTPPPGVPKPPFAPAEKGVPTRAVERVGKLTPEQIESKVYKYLKRHRGVLDVKKCAKRLKVSEDEVEAAARALVAKGTLEEQ